MYQNLASIAKDMVEQKLTELGKLILVCFNLKSIRFLETKILKK